MVIYKITNMVTGKIYIGQDSKNCSHYLGSGKLIKMSVAKYGREHFKREILEHCETRDMLNNREVYWINKFNSTNLTIGYNIQSGGNVYSHWQGKKLSEEHKAKIRRTSRSNPLYGSANPDFWTQELRDEVSKRMKGKAAWNKGKIGIYSDETINQMSESAKRRDHTTESWHNRNRKISESQQIKIRDERTGVVYESIGTARQNLHLTHYMYSKLLNKGILTRYED